MRSALPKVLHPLAGKPMLQHAIDAAAQTDPAAIHVVVGHGAEQVKAGVSHPNLQWALQAEQKGTGHAVAQGLAAVAEDATVLITYGDVPLVRPETLQAMVARCRDTLVLLTATLDDPTGYGRIIRNTDGAVQAIVEQKDASPEQLAVREVNTGMMALPAKYLREWLPALSADNAQGEYYLTDIIAMAVAAGVAVDVAQPEALWEVEGVNNRLQLNALERQYQRLIAEQLMTDGATLADAQAAGAVTLNYGVFINNVISFLIVAWAVFFLVRGLNRVKRKEEQAAPVEPPPTPEVPEDILLLREIRDNLKR